MSPRSDTTSTSPAGPTCIRAMPTLEVRHLAASLEFHASSTFLPVSEWGEPHHFATVRRGHIAIGNPDRRRDMTAKRRPTP